MTAGYTEDELNALQHAMLENQPADPSSGEIQAALQVIGAVTRARYNGLLLKILFQSKATLLLSLSCVVASELMAVINHAYSGWHAGGTIQMLDVEIGIAVTEQSMDVISFAAGADLNGLPITSRTDIKTL